MALLVTLELLADVGRNRCVGSIAEVEDLYRPRGVRAVDRRRRNMESSVRLVRRVRVLSGRVLGRERRGLVVDTRVWCLRRVAAGAVREGGLVDRCRWRLGLMISRRRNGGRRVLNWRNLRGRRTCRLRRRRSRRRRSSASHVGVPLAVHALARWWVANGRLSRRSGRKCRLGCRLWRGRRWGGLWRRGFLGAEERLCQLQRTVVRGRRNNLALTFSSLGRQ